MESNEVLPFPKITAETLPDSPTIVLTVSGKPPQTFQGRNPEDSMHQVLAQVTEIANTLGRPVRLTARVDQTRTSLIVSPGGDISHEETVTDSERRPWYRRPALVISAAVVLALLGGGGAAAWHATHPPTPAPVSTPAPRTPVDAQETRTSALTPALSTDGTQLAYSTAKNIVIADARTGKTIQTVDLNDIPRNDPQWTATARPEGNSGFLLTYGKNHATLWNGTKLDTGTSIPASQQIMVTRASQNFLIGADHPATPDTVRRIGSSTDRFQSPSKGASFLIAKDSSGVWATAKDGGTIVTAARNGDEQASHKLAAPRSGAKLASWVGVAANGQVLSKWTQGKDVLLAFQSPDNDAVTNVVTLNDPKADVTLSLDGKTALAGRQVIDLEKPEARTIEHTLSDPVAVADGFTGTVEKRSAFVARDGEHTVTGDGTLIGFNADGDSVTVSKDHITITPKGK